MVVGGSLVDSFAPEAGRQQAEAGYFGSSYGQMKCIITCKLRRILTLKQYLSWRTQMFTHMRIKQTRRQSRKITSDVQQGLGLHKIAEFNDHDGFQWNNARRGDLDWHIEFNFAEAIPYNLYTQKKIYSFFITLKKKNGNCLRKNDRCWLLE